MEILPGIEIIGLALWIKKEKTLIISDLHLGYEEMLERQGVLTPRFQLKDMVEQLTKIFKKVQPETVVINGDLKHEFGNILGQEWRDILRLFEFLEKNCSEIIIVKGNHDLFLGPLARKKNITLVPFFQRGDILIAHGDKLIIEGKTIIIGHDHPAITIRDKVKAEKYKCFLRGKWKRKNLIVMPSFNPLTKGMDVKQGKLLSPYLTQIKNFEVYVVEDRTYYFGKIKDV